MTIVILRTFGAYSDLKGVIFLESIGVKTSRRNHGIPGVV
jgi:hypothetical protein